ncbi:MAG: glycosyl hydrolase [Bacteroidota bacterium]
MKNIYLLKFVFSSFILILSGCMLENDNTQVEPRGQEIPHRELAKFEPEKGVLVFAGQDLESIGGMDKYRNGYVDHFPVPAGVTLYTGMGAGDSSFGENSQALLGVFETMDAGNGPSNMSLIMSHDKFKECALAIGLSMVNSEEKVATGELDDNIKRLGEFCKNLKNPVFLRIGYEFDGHSWNHYNREAYLTPYKRIKDQFDRMGVENVAYVWQSTGWVSDPYQLEEWYPGDDYVDWCGFSFFSRWREVEMIEFARKKGKPVFIAEASATISGHTVKFDGKTKETILSKPEQAEEAWEKWFVPFFEMIENNTDVIKAIHYINTDWKSRPMWFNNPTFQKVDARLQLNEKIKSEWSGKMDMDLYLNLSDQPFN